MIISHKYKFIFIKTRKTAGTSIEAYLSSLCDDKDTFTPINPPVPPHNARNYENFYNHMPAHAVRELVNDKIWTEYFKFCVERNPWDKTASFYYFISKYRHSNSLDVDQFFEKGYNCSDLDKYTEPSNPSKIIIDHIIQYEDLNNELSRIFSILKIPFHGTLNVHAKSEFRDRSKHYTELFSEQQLDKIRKIFSREIALYGYQIDRPH